MIGARLRRAAAGAVLIGAFALAFDARAAIVLPPDFVAENVTAQPFDIPTAIAFAPSGRMFVAEKAGRVWAVRNGVRGAAPVLDLSDKVLSNGDHGLLGLGVDPDFATNRRLYVLFTVDPDSNGVDDNADSYGRLERYAFPPGDSNAVDLSTRAVLFGVTWSDGPPRGSDAHAEGAIRWGHDGTLLVTLADGAHYEGVDRGGLDPNLFLPGRCNPLEDIGAFRSQYLGSLAGKLLRLDRETGHGLPSNPFWDGAPRSARSRIWATGMRNPFRFAVRPGTGSPDAAAGDPGDVLVGDVGWVTWEDLELAPDGGRNFGWPCWEGPAPSSPYQNAQPTRAGCATIGTPENPSTVSLPVMWWNHNVPAASQPPGTIGNCITGGVFYEAQRYPSEYWGGHFFGDYGQNWIKVARFDEHDHGHVESVVDFATGAEGPVDFAVHPQNHDVHFIAIQTGHVRRIRYTGPQPNRSPVAVASASSPVGAKPLAVAFASAGTSDADGDPLAFAWSFGDGAAAAGDTVSHVFVRPGRFDVVLTADDQQGGVGRDTVVVVVTDGAGFPTTAVVDAFSRADGSPGAPWSALSGGFAVNAGALVAGCCEPEMLSRGDPAGPEQEAFVTLVTVDPASRVDLLLRAQDTTLAAPRLRVSYEPGASRVRAATREAGDWVERDTLESVTIPAGHRFGARALSNGAIQVWDDSTLVGLLSVQGWAWSAAEGRVGLGLASGGTTRLDDFGGGTARVDPNEPPRLKILQPADSSFFVGGDTLQLVGVATDAETPDDSLAFRWSVDLTHNNHVHPNVFSATTTNASWATEEHEDGTGWFVTVRATAGDPDFHTTTRSVRVFPEVDFAPAALATTPVSPDPLGAFEVRFQLHNHGRAPSPRRHWQLVAGAVTLAEGDTAIAGRDSVEIVRRVPALLGVGAYDLRVVADTLRASVEPNETNNATTRRLVVVPGPVPDSLPPWWLAPATWAPAADRAWLRLRTDEPSRVTVAFGATPALGDSAASPTRTADHAFDFGPLPPGARVWVRATTRDAAGNARVGPLDSLDTQPGTADAARPPARLRLSAARPNPARGGVSWALELPAASRVEFEVLDVSGRVVWRETPAERAAGRWTLAWPGTARGGREAPAGLYFARVRAGAEVLVRRVVRLASR